MQLLLQSHHYTLPVLALFHVDEIDHDDSAKIAQTDLADYLLDRVEVGSRDRVFEPIRLADELAGVDIDGDQRLGLIDDYVAA